MTTSELAAALVIILLICATPVIAVRNIGWFRSLTWSKIALLIAVVCFVLGAVLDHLLLPFSHDASAPLGRRLAISIVVIPFAVLWGVPALANVMQTCLLLSALAVRWLGVPAFSVWLVATAKGVEKSIENMFVAGFLWLSMLAGTGACLVVYHFIVLLLARWLLGVVLA